MEKGRLGKMVNLLGNAMEGAYTCSVRRYSMNRRTLVFGLYLILLLGSEIFSEDRKVVLVLDVSGSMNEEKKFQAVQSYIEQDLFPNLLKPNDQFTLILFGNNPRQAFSEKITDDSSRKQILERVRKLKADDNYTDIGMALEYLFDLLSGMKGQGEVKVIFITDGKNTPPRTSPYYGKDLSVDARFREIGKKISQEGWYIYVIGIGKETDAKHIVSAVEGSVLRETDTKLQNVKVEEYLDQTEKARMAKESERKRTEQEKYERSLTGVPAWIHQWALSLGVSPNVLYGVLIVLILIILIGIGSLLWRKVRPIKILVWDSQLSKTNAVRLSLGVGSSVTFNMPPYWLPVLGGEDHPALKIGRNLKGLWIMILDDTLVSDDSPYRDREKHRLKKRTLDLISGEQVFIL